MAIPIKSNVDYRTHQAQNLVLHSAASAPTTYTAVGGQVYWNNQNGNKRIYVYDDQITAWVSVPRLDRAETVTTGWTFTAAPALNAGAGNPPFTTDCGAPASAGATATRVTNLNANYLNGYNTSQSSTASTVAVRNSDGTLTVAGPTSGSHAATRDYVDSVGQGLFVKDPCLVATTANITLSGEQTIDGVLTSASRVLVKDQSTGTQNGIYVSAAGAWTRATDSDTSAEVDSGMYTWATSGATNIGKSYVQTTLNPTLGTDALVFTNFYQAVAYTSGNGLGQTGTQFWLKIGGSNTWTANRLLYTSSTSAVDVVAAGTSLQVMQSAGASAPAWSTATFPANTTRGAVLVASAASTWAAYAVGAAGTILRSDGTDTLWTTNTFPNTAGRGSVLIASAANVVSAYAVGSAGQILRTDGTDTLWTTNTFPNTAARGSVLIASAANVVSAYAVGGAGTILRSDGTDTLWTTNTFPNTAARGSVLIASAANVVSAYAVGSAGQILRSNGTDTLWTTSTFADTYAVSTILYASGANAVTGLATANRAALTTSATGVPVMTAMASDGHLIIGSAAGAPAAALLAVGALASVTVVNGSNTITIDAIQDIRTTATPRFARIGIGAAAGATTEETVVQPVRTTGSPTMISWSGAAHTTLSASTEAIDVNVNLARTVQFATGAIALQRAWLIQAPTYGAVGASVITDCATLAIDSPPQAGTNVTLTNAYTLWMSGEYAQLIGIGRRTTSNVAGKNLTIWAGGATSGATDKAGGDLYLASGLSTGTGTSNIYFQAPPAGSTGTGTNALATVGTLSGAGKLTITNVTISAMTAGSVLFAGPGSAVSQSNANLFWDYALNRLGIGTASPSASLHIVGGGILVGASQSIYGSALTSNRGQIELYNAGTGSMTLYSTFASADQIFMVGNNSDDTGMEGLRIAHGGHVGFGVTSPTAVAHLKAGTTAAGTAPLKFIRTSAALLTTPEDGAVEVTSAGAMYYTPTTTIGRKKVVLGDVFTVTGDGSAASFNLDHNFGTRDLVVGICESNIGSSYRMTIVEWEPTTTSRVVVRFDEVPANGDVHKVMIAAFL